MLGKVLTEEEWTAHRRAQAAGRPRPPPPQPRKEVTVDAFRQMTYVTSHAVYNSAKPDPKGIEFFLPPDLSDMELGAKVRTALAASRFIAPDHPEWEAVMRAPYTDEDVRAWNRRLLEAAGVKTQKALRAGARSVALTLQDGIIAIAPWQQRSGGGWTPLDPALTITVPESDPDEVLGHAVREALSRSH